MIDVYRLTALDPFMCLRPWGLLECAYFHSPTNMMFQKGQLGFVFSFLTGDCPGWGDNGMQRSMSELFGMMEILHILIEVLLPQCVKIIKIFTFHRS